MRYRNPEVLTTIAGSMAPLVLAYRGGSPELRVYYNQIIDLMCRKLENFVVPRVSKRAYAEAENLSIGDLRGMHWNDQRTKMKDRDRSIFHWEHVVPVKSLRSQLLTLTDPSVEAVKAVIAQADVAWILRSENDALNNKGFRTKRPDPMACYAACKIEFWEYPELAQLPGGG